ncbi:hypothetical protein MMC30_006083 [Trapelia coarctata]|nr:hypothetical protein [Trapelia coarctata]
MHISFLLSKSRAYVTGRKKAQELSHVWLPVEVCQAFERVFGLVYDPLSELYLANETLRESLQAQNPTFTFKLGTDKTSTNTVDITLPYASFDQLVTTVYPNVGNATSYFSLRRAAHETQYTLGRAFLQESYLIADYERSQFSINQCIFAENLIEDIQAIPSLNSSNANGTGTGTSSAQSGSRSLLAPGMIGLASVAGAAVVLILSFGTVFGLRKRKRRRQRSEGAKASNIEGVDANKQTNELQGDTDHKIEIDGQQMVRELHGVPRIGAELEGDVAAHEMNGDLAGLHELP